MNHKVFGNRLSRPIKQRQALYKSLLNALFTHGKIRTSQAKAKAIRGAAEKLVSKAKRQTLSDLREISKFLTLDIAKKLYQTANEEFSERTSGYTRITRLPERFSDTSEIVELELIKKVMVVDTPKVNVKEKAQEVKKEAPKEDKPEVKRKTTKVKKVKDK